MAISEVKRLAQALSQEYNSANPDLAKCGQFLNQLKVPPLKDAMWMLGDKSDTPTSAAAACRQQPQQRFLY